MPFVALETSLSEGFLRDHCALCSASLDSVLDEVPCPHWFVTPGWRGFRIDRLTPVFEVFDMHAVIDFLRVLAASGRPRDNPVPYRTWVEEGSTRVAIDWRRRGWLFEYDGHAGAVAPVQHFLLTTFFDGALMEHARIEFGQRERTVTVTTLVSRRREPGAPVAPERRQG